MYYVLLNSKLISNEKGIVMNMSISYYSMQTDPHPHHPLSCPSDGSIKNLYTYFQKNLGDKISSLESKR
jgi:hypothetical protein